MSKLTVVCHHGSPGTKDDFNEVTKLLKEVNIHTIRRYPKDAINIDADIQIGYSFGSFKAIREALRSPKKTKAVILIAPYFFTGPQTPFKSLILKLPILNKALINKAMKKSIEEMLEKSSSPLEPNDIYKEQAKSYLNPSLLLHSIKEKAIDQKIIKKKLKELNKKNIPVYVIRSDVDETSDEEQIDIIKKYLNFSQEKILKQKGHALLWTAPNEVSEYIQSVIDTFAVKTKRVEKRKIGYRNSEHKDNNVASFLDFHATNRGSQNVLKWVSLEDKYKWLQSPTDNIEHKAVTFKELHYSVGVLAGAFKEKGILKGDRVIVFVPMSLPMYTAMFALQKIGAIPVFLDSWARKDQLEVSAKTVAPKAIISVEKAYDYLQGIESIDNIEMKISVGPTSKNYTYALEELLKSNTWSDIEPVEKEHTALITFTTGSSGTPKGADRSHRFLAAQHYALHKHIPYKDKEEDLPTFPIFSLNNIAEGITTILPMLDVGVPSEYDPLMLIAQIKSLSLTCMTLSPSLMNGLAKYAGENKILLPNLRRIITGGAPVSKDDVQRIKSVCPNAEILILYGSTEVEPMAHINDFDMLKDTIKDKDWIEEGVNVGQFDDELDVEFIKINKGTVTIKDQDDWNELILKKGMVGEIIVAGEHVCQRYYNNEEAFKKAKIVDHTKKVWHRTGDLGRIDSQNNLWLVGRIHNAIQRDGDYFFPVRAEIILKKLHYVKQAAYLGIDNEKLGQATYCVFTVKEEFIEKIEMTLDSWKTEIKQRMEKNGMPVDGILLVNEIPMDPRHQSKVEYDKLRASILEGELY